MPALSVERLQAASGGMNTDASPDYVPPTEAPLIQNMLPGRPGRLVMRGALSEGLELNADGVTNPALAFWAFDDKALLKTNDGSSDKTWHLTSSFTAAADITATLVESPLDGRHARYGASVYGAIVDAASPQLGKWSCAAAAIVPQANAPFQWTDLQVFAQRLFILGGSVPGTTTPVINSGRVLYWTDADSTADLSLLASWKDDVSGLVNQINYDGDDTPIGLAGCGRYMAIIGSRSINILTGAGSSSFAVRNLTKNWGCVDIKSIVEVDDGFFFQSERGFAFCDGVTVVSVSDSIRDSLAGYDDHYAASFGHGYLALSLSTSLTWLFHMATKTWVQFTSASFPAGEYFSAYSVHRSLSYPLIWDGSVIWLADAITAPDGVGFDGIPDVAGFAAIPARVKTRIARLSSPTSSATVSRVLVDFILAGADTAWSATLKDEAGTTLKAGTAAGIAGVATRQRAQFDVFAETSTAYLDVVYNPVGTPNPGVAELYDCWLEFEPGRVTPGF